MHNYNHNCIQHLTNKLPSLGFRKETYSSILFQEGYFLFSSVSGSVLALFPGDVAQCCEAFAVTDGQATGNNTGRMPLPY